MTKWKTLPLAEIAEINPTWSPNHIDHDEEVSFVPMSAVSAETASVTDAETRRLGDVLKGYTTFADRDVLVAKITPCFENGKIAHARLSHRYGFGSTEFHVLRPDRKVLEDRYLLHYLRLDSIRRDGERKMTGSAGQRRVPKHFLDSLSIPLPPLDEQKRIADILDRAEALRASRRAALALLDTLPQAIFTEMFGDPRTNPKGWSSAALRDLLAGSLRNGLSPSNAGKVEAKVLTLSAVTGTEFDGTSWKLGTFEREPPKDQRVAASDFLICRGNGNLNLVGRGYFPPTDQSDVTFPDTIIAAPISTQRVARGYLQVLWMSSEVRRQIESLARTTNGTHKVNQNVLEGIRLLLPPLPLQQEFARRVAAVEEVRASQRASLTKLDELFASLQHRAFRGEL